MKKLLLPFKVVFNEIKSIRWCKFKDWIKYSFIAIAIATIMALLLTGFDILSYYIVIIASQLSINGIFKTITQVIIFICSAILIILCFLQANKGQNVLNGLTNQDTSLFNNIKEVGTDKVITKIISILIIIVFVLSILEY